MKKYTIELSLLSPTLSGSGEGFGAVIDTDIVFDEVGIPFIPAKRIKGCLRDAAMEVASMFTSSAIEFPVKINETFGSRGALAPAPVYFSNLTVEDYEETEKWLKYFLTCEKYDDLISKERILATFTEIRRQTAIGPDGVALDHTLRTARLIRKGTIFRGEILIEGDRKETVDTLILACANLRRMGTRRNRGFGEISCALFHDDARLPLPEELEALCMN